MKTKYPKIRRTAAEESYERALGSNWLGGSKPRPGMRPPDRRVHEQGTPAELLLRRLGFELPTRRGGQPEAVRRALAVDPVLRKLGFASPESVKVALVKSAAVE